MLPDAYVSPPAVRANLVQGGGGTFVDANGSSRGISNDQDRARLLQLRQLCDVLVTDGETARLENYGVPKSCDLAVITKRGFTPRQSDTEHHYIELNLSPAIAIAELEQRGYKSILLEVGPALLTEIFKARLVDELCLTNTQHSQPDLARLGIASAQCVYQEVVEDTSFTVWREIQPL